MGADEIVKSIACANCEPASAILMYEPVTAYRRANRVCQVSSLIRLTAKERLCVYVCVYIYRVSCRDWKIVSRNSVRTCACTRGTRARCRYGARERETSRLHTV